MVDEKEISSVAVMVALSVDERAEMLELLTVDTMAVRLVVM